MCVIAIVDADSLSALVTRRDRSGDGLFREWIKERHGILAFTSSGKFFNEIRRNQAVMALVQRYEQGGQLRKISVEELTIADDQLAEKPCRSNDLHILSLALASEARVLCSKMAISVPTLRTKVFCRLWDGDDGYCIPLMAVANSVVIF